MRIAFLLLSVIWLHTASSAQQFFNRRLTLHSLSSTLTSVIQRDGKYYCTGITLDSSNIVPNTNTHYNVIGTRFVVIDSNGNILRDTFYQEYFSRNLYPFYNTLCSMPDKSFLLAITNDIDSINNQFMMLLRFDSSGNMIGRHEYVEPFCNDSLLYNVLDIKPTGTGEWLTLASIMCKTTSPVAYILLTKLDSNFNIIWQQKYGDGRHNFLPGKLLIEGDGYVLGCGTNDDLIVAGTTRLHYRAYIMKTDTAGNKLWEWFSDSSKFIGQPKDIQRTQDGGYIYCGYGDGVELTNGPYFYMYFRAWVEKIDSNRNTVWSKGYNAPYYDPGGASVFNVMKQTANGNIVLFGGNYKYGFAGPAPYNNVNGWFLTLDANGDSLRERIYTSINSCNSTNTFYDAKPTSDGGFIMVGESTDYCNTTSVDPIQRGWIVKVDSNGCLGPNDPQCQPLNVNQPGAVNNVYVYPNPAHDVLHVRTGTIGGEMQAILSDVSGRELESKALGQNTLTNIEMKGLPPGLYLLKVLQLDGAVKTYKVSHY